MNRSSDQLLIPAEFYFQASIEIPFQEGLREAIAERKHPEIGSPLPELMFYQREGSPLLVSLAWNEEGVCLQLDVSGKKLPPEASVTSPHRDDHFLFFLDTRDLKTVHRPGKFCHRFCVLPPGLRNGRKAKAIAFQERVSVSAGHQNLATSEDIPVHGSAEGNDYRISVWIDSSVVHSFEPDNAPSLGYFHIFHDREFGERLFAVGEKFPVTNNPSLWPSLKLVR